MFTLVQRVVLALVFLFLLGIALFEDGKTAIINFLVILFIMVVLGIP